MLDTRISICADFVRHAQTTPPGFWNRWTVELRWKTNLLKWKKLREYHFFLWIFYFLFFFNILYFLDSFDFFNLI